MADQCRHCKVELPENHKGACPECGRIGQTKFVKPRNVKSVTLVGKVKIRVFETSTREYLKKCWPELIAVVFIGVASPFITSELSGMWAIGIGLCLSVICFALGLNALQRVTEKETREKTTTSQ